MDSIKIRGGNELNGRIRTSGAKNAVLPAMAASLLTSEELTIGNVPRVRDVDTMLKVLAHLGVSHEFMSERRLKLHKRNGMVDAPYDLVRKMRASVLVLGPLTARHGRAEVSLPGGCAIGARPIDMHLKALEALGAEINLRHGYVEAKAKRLKGGDFTFPKQTVTGTENIMMAACLADGRTTLRNAAREPEIEDLARLLKAMGARIEGAGSDTIVIFGVDELHGATHEVIPDRIEAGTFVIAGAMAGGEVTITDAVPSHLRALLEKLAETGLTVEEGDDWIKVTRRTPLASKDVRTAPYPGFPTDLQAQFMAYMTTTEGTSVIWENIFEKRFMHVGELQRMGAAIRVDGRKATVEGPTPLQGAPVMATDLRASACMLLAGLVADGETTLSRVYHIDRGYEKIEEKLSALGADMERIKT